MNLRRCAAFLRQVFPDFVGSEYEDRRKEPRQPACDAVDSGLRRASFATLCRKCVKPVLENIEIKRAQIHDAEVVQRVVNAMKIEALVELQALGHKLLRTPQHPAVELFERVLRHRVHRRIEVKKIPERKSKRV